MCSFPGLTVSRECILSLFCIWQCYFWRCGSNRAHEIRRILGVYELASGQKINLDKSVAVFSKNTTLEAKEVATNILGVTESMRNILLCDLLHPTQSWNENLIRQIFFPIDADIICALPSSRLGVGDELIWHFDRFGRYTTTKNGYHMAKSICHFNRRQGHVGECS